MKRSTDQIDRRIAEWERMRADFGPAAPATVTDIIDHEVDKLRRKRTAMDQPQANGRRATDRQAHPRELVPPFG